MSETGTIDGVQVSTLRHTLLDIAERSRLELNTVRAAADTVVEGRLLEEAAK
jgi:aminopeptidase-like protein